MTRLEARLAALASAKKKALVTFLCAGDPSMDETVELAITCARAGADVIELGVPFSDPTADGPAIARAAARAISRGGGLSATLRACAAIRARTDVPIVLFGYYNPIFVMGEQRLCAAAKAAGADALLVVDLPIEEGASLRVAAKEQGLAVVPLLTPTSSDERVRAVQEATKACAAGFVYYVSVAGVTGNAAAPLAMASRAAGALHERLHLPVVVGFGVDSPARARDAAAECDGVVVGTAIVRAIEDAPTVEAGRRVVHDLVSSLRAAVDELAASVQTA